MIRRPPRSTPLYSSAASDVYKRQLQSRVWLLQAGQTESYPYCRIFVIHAYLTHLDHGARSRKYIITGWSPPSQFHDQSLLTLAIAIVKYKYWRPELGEVRFLSQARTNIIMKDASSAPFLVSDITSVMIYAYLVLCRCRFRLHLYRALLGRLGASNALCVPVHRKDMCLQCQSELWRCCSSMLNHGLR